MITLDTNIFVYLVDDRDPAKQAIAAQVIARAAALRAPVALQVVGEFQNASIRKLRLPPFVAAQAARNILTGFDVFGAAVSDADSALGQLAAGRLSYWDALLISSARAAGCSALISEDMQDGTTVMGLEIVNPFGRDGLSDRAQTLLA
jgi:predicted nucleic acid-binding protein